MVPRLGWHFDVLLLFAAGYNDYTMDGTLIGSESVNSDFTMEHKWRILWRTRLFFSGLSTRGTGYCAQSGYISPRLAEHVPDRPAGT